MDEQFQDTIQGRLLKIVFEHLGMLLTDEEYAKMPLSDYGMDSLDMPDLLMAVEEEFGIEVLDEDTQMLVESSARVFVKYIKGSA